MPLPHFILSQTLYEVGAVIVLVLQMRKLRPRQVQNLQQLLDEAPLYKLLYVSYLGLFKVEKLFKTPKKIPIVVQAIKNWFCIFREQYLITMPPKSPSLAESPCG